MRKATLLAILAAASYAMSIPAAKIFLRHMDPVMLAALFYLGAGIGMAAIGFVRRRMNVPMGDQLVQSDLPFVIGMVLLDILAPILLLSGVALTNASTASLLNNSEILFTTVIAAIVFSEAMSWRLLIGIALVFIASLVLTFDAAGPIGLDIGAALILLACLSWGIENNFTRRISDKSAVQIVTIKGTFSGLGSLVVALVLHRAGVPLGWALLALAVGFVAYGLSITSYVRAQATLGAAKTSVYYSIAPFVGVALSFLMLGEVPGIRFYVALAVMLVATWIIAKDQLGIQHTHEHVHVHTHEHSHGDLVHTHPHSHAHSHYHAHDTGMESVHNHSHETLPEHGPGETHEHLEVHPELA